MTSIPCVVIPVMNAPYLIQKLVNSIDFRVENVLFIHNHDAKQPNAEVSRVIRSASNQFVGNFSVHSFNVNAGVAASWNYGAMYQKCPYWFYVNSDVSFNGGTLSRVAEIMNSGSDKCVVRTFGIGWSAFALTAAAFQKIGPFDENIWPAYSEDCDYVKRIQQQSCELQSFGKKEWFYHYGSASWRTSRRNSPYLKQITRSGSFFNNFDYMDKKWKCNTGGNCSDCYSGYFKREAPREWRMDFRRRKSRGGPLICIGCGFDWSVKPS